MKSSITAPNLRSVLDGYQAIARRDLGRVMALVGPDSTVQTRIEAHTGGEAVRRYFKEVFATDFTNDPETLFVTDDSIAVMTRLRIVGASTGIESHERLIELWTPNGEGYDLGVLDVEESLIELGLTERADRVERFRSAFVASNAGDLGPTSELLEPDFELHRGTASLEQGPIRGIDGLREFLAPDVFESQQIDVLQVVDADEKVLAATRFSARGAGSGIELSTETFQVWQLRDGKAVRAEIFQERDAALEALFASVSA